MILVQQQNLNTGKKEWPSLMCMYTSRKQMTHLLMDVEGLQLILDGEQTLSCALVTNDL